MSDTPTINHLGTRDDDQWEEDRMRAIQRAWDTGEMVVFTRDLPSDLPPDPPARLTLRQRLARLFTRV